MPRLHLVELEDLPWVPSVLKDTGRDLLDLGFHKMRFYEPLVPHLAALVDATGVRNVVDLASGGGGGALSMCKTLRGQGKADIHFLLTDRFPNNGAAQRIQQLGDANVAYHPHPVDALTADHRPTGIRTMFGALHHFQPPEVRQLLGAVVAERAPVAIFDVGANLKLRKVPTALVPLVSIPNLLMLFVVTWLLVPLVRPLSLGRLVLTYLLPLVPILVAWDGTVSALRAYAPEELLEMARSAPGGGTYDWEAGASGPAVYLVGKPRA